MQLAFKISNEITTEEEFIEEFIKISKDEFNHIPKSVRFNKRLKRTLGRYAYDDKSMQEAWFDFNTNLISGRFTKEQQLKIMKHELVHWLVRTKLKISEESHGLQFRKYAAKYGAYAEACFKGE